MVWDGKMVKLTCLGRSGGSEREGSEVVSSEASSSPEPNGGPDDPVLYENTSTVSATKQKLKGLLKRDSRNERALMNRDPEFRVLAKVFGEEEALPDLEAFAEAHFDQLTQLIPFLLNTLLYGFGHEERTEATQETYLRIRAMSRSKSNPGSGSRPSGTTGAGLGTTAKLIRSKREKELEEFVYGQCQRSVGFALLCSWFFTSSLILGPQDLYHRTMSLLLGMESAIMLNKKPGDLFHHSEIEIEPASVTDSMSPSSKRPTQGLGKANILKSGTALPVEASPPVQPVDEEAVVPTESVTEISVGTTGDDSTVQVRFDKLDHVGQENLKQWMEVRQERGNFFHAELDFIKCLTDISFDLFDVPREGRKEALRKELEKLNQYLPRNVFIPTDGRTHRVLRIVPSEAFVFSTKERCPYLMVFEVEDHPHETRELLAPSFRTRRKRSSTPKPDEGTGRDEKNYPVDRFNFASDLSSVVAGSKHEMKTLSEDIPTVDSTADPEVLKAFGEPWSEKSQRIREESPYGSRPNWRLSSVIVKARDRLRQEMFAGRLIREFARIYEAAKVPLWVYPYKIIATSADSGLIETIVNSRSIDSIKKNTPNFVSLSDWFEKKFGQKGTPAHKRAIRNFVASMAGYSVVCFVLQIKDRHNGNLMLDADGHIVHIDFGFLLSNSPGGNFEFEKAPFKLSQELLDILGGPKSSNFKLFRKLCNKGYIEVCRHRTKLLLLVDTFFHGNESMPCFVAGRDAVLSQLKNRMLPGTSSKEKKAFFNRQINLSMHHWTTKWYDRYQKCFTGID